MAIRNVLAVAAAAFLATPSLAALGDDAGGDDAGEYTFTVLKDGTPVGEHRFTFDRTGDRIEIHEATEIEVRFAAVPLYVFEHESRELWENSRPIRIDATTNDNGKKLDITVRADGDGYVRTVNGRVDRFDGSTAVLAFWNKATLEHRAFFSAVQDKTFDASFEYAGREKLALAGQELDVEHYRMVGDEEHDLWFDRAGHIVKVEFRRYGSDMAYVRDQLVPRQPRATCPEPC
jgi:Family of unknown function (DUF6134)